MLAYSFQFWFAGPIDKTIVGCLYPIYFGPSCALGLCFEQIATKCNRAGFLLAMYARMDIEGILSSGFPFVEDLQFIGQSSLASLLLDSKYSLAKKTKKQNTTQFVHQQLICMLSPHPPLRKLQDSVFITLPFCHVTFVASEMIP